MLSWLFAQQKEYNKALIQEKALYQRNPKELNAIFNLGKVAFDNKDYSAAKNCFSFINKNSNFREDKIDANLYLAKIAVETGENPETENLFQKMFKEFGKNTLTIKLQVEYADFLTFSKNNANKSKGGFRKCINFI